MQELRSACADGDRVFVAMDTLHELVVLRSDAAAPCFELIKVRPHGSDVALSQTDLCVHAQSLIADSSELCHVQAIQLCKRLRKVCCNVTSDKRL